MRIKGEGKTGLRSTYSFGQMEKGSGKQLGSNAEPLLTYKERKRGKQMWKRKTKKHNHSFGSLKKNWKALLAFANTKTASDSFLKITVKAYSKKKKKVTTKQTQEALSIHSKHITLQKVPWALLGEKKHSRGLISSLSCYKASINSQLHYLPLLSLCNGFL